MAVTDSNKDIVVQRATADQITEHFKNNSQVWAAPLAQRDYLELQYQLSESIANKGNTAYWVLYDRAQSDKVISSCTTYLRHAIVNTGQGSRPARAVVVADLFTHAEYRQQGMATKLLKGVQGMLDNKTDPKVEFSILYSGLHTDFCEALGWKPRSATQLRVLVGKGKVEYDNDAADSGSDPPKERATWLTFDKLDWLSGRDQNMAKLRLSSMRDKKTHVQILPSDELTKYHVVKSKLYAHHLAKNKDKQTVYGAVSIAEQTQIGAWVWWVHDFRQRKLYVGRVASTRHTGLERRMKEILHAAAAEASKWGLREVVVWDPTPQVIAGANMLADEIRDLVKAVVEDRVEMVPCLRWHRGEEREVGWEERQYYGWC